MEFWREISEGEIFVSETLRMFLEFLKGEGRFSETLRWERESEEKCLE